jgi:hypothetical protein
MVAPAPHRRLIAAPPLVLTEVSCVVAADGQRIPSESLDRLERLDDTVFAALAGDAAALERLREAWREAAAEIEAPLLAETRRHYLDRAQSRWARSQTTSCERLTVGFAALEVLALLGE